MTREDQGAALVGSSGLPAALCRLGLVPHLLGKLAALPSPRPPPGGAAAQDQRLSVLPYANYRCDLVLILGAVCHRNKAAQEQIMEHGGVPVLLNQCQVGCSHANAHRRQACNEPRPLLAVCSGMLTTHMSGSVQYWRCAISVRATQQFRTLLLSLKNRHENLDLDSRRAAVPLHGRPPHRIASRSLGADQSGASENRNSNS